MLSTKWVDTVYLSNIAHQTDAITRRAAWLDLTMNKGNSGGPIIRIGNSNEQDIVVGISTFILNPYANDALFLETLLSSNTMPDILYGDMSQNKIKALFASAIANNSIGISGCISINYAAEVLKQIPKTTNRVDGREP